MQELKTQQFAKFYIKEMKLKFQKDYKNKNSFNEIKISTEN